MPMSPGAMTPLPQNLAIFGEGADPLYSLLIATYGYHGFGGYVTIVII